MRIAEFYINESVMNHGLDFERNGWLFGFWCLGVSGVWGWRAFAVRLGNSFSTRSETPDWIVRMSTQPESCSCIYVYQSGG